MLSVLLTVNLKLAQHGWRHIDMPRKEQYWKNPEYYRAKGREEYKRNKKKYKKRYESNIIYMKLHGAIQRAKKHNLPFDITEQDIKDIWPIDNKCPALNIQFIIGGYDTQNYDSPALDRIIPSKGYVKGNIQIVSALANGIMSSATPEQVLQVGHYFKKLIDSK